MFKENKQFWLYFLGIIIMFFMLFFVLRTGYGANSSLMFSGFPFNIIKGDVKIFPFSGYKIDETKNYQAIISTNIGDIVVELYGKNAPNTVGNFVYLANNNYYDSLKFHRYIPGLLLQGGSFNSMNSDPNDDKFGGPGYTIKDEINWDSLDYSEQKRQQLKSEGFSSATTIKSMPMQKYSLAMASNGANTSGSQFFIVLADSNDYRVQALEGKHTVFGHVIGGFTVLEKLPGLELNGANTEDPQPKDFKIKKITIIVKN